VAAKETIWDGGCRKISTASFLTKIGQMQSAGCWLCRIAREATDGLVAETHGHINRSGCEGMATTDTAAHHSIWRHLYDSMHAAQKPKSKLKFVTLENESNMSTLLRREEFLRICSKEDSRLAKKVQDTEVTIPVKKSQEARYNLDPGSLFVNRFWGRRPDGVAINEALQIVYILELSTLPCLPSKCPPRQISFASFATVHGFGRASCNARIH